jgi:hypothetical protein
MKSKIYLLSAIEIGFYILVNYLLISNEGYFTIHKVPSTIFLALCTAFIFCLLSILSLIKFGPENSISKKAGITGYSILAALIFGHNCTVAETSSLHYYLLCLFFLGLALHSVFPLILHLNLPQPPYKKDITLQRKNDD